MKTQKEIEQLAENYANEEVNTLYKEVGREIKQVVFNHALIGFKVGYNKCQEDVVNKKYTEEDMIAFAYQFSSINVADFRKHLRDFDINLKEKNKQ